MSISDRFDCKSLGRPERVYDPTLHDLVEVALPKKKGDMSSLFKCRPSACPDIIPVSRVSLLTRSMSALDSNRISRPNTTCALCESYLLKQSIGYSNNPSTPTFRPGVCRRM